MASSKRSVLISLRRDLVFRRQQVHVVARHLNVALLGMELADALQTELREYIDTCREAHVGLFRASVEYRKTEAWLVESPPTEDAITDRLSAAGDYLREAVETMAKVKRAVNYFGASLKRLRVHMPEHSAEVDEIVGEVHVEFDALKAMFQSVKTVHESLVEKLDPHA